MKALLCISATAVVALTACTTVPMASVSNGASSAAPSGKELYCWKRNLSESGGKLYCNWVADRSQACERADSTPVEMARFTDPAPSGRCETGEYLVKILPR